MEYPYIIGEEFPEYAKKATWKTFHAYIDAHSQRLIDEFPGYGVQSISIFQSKCTNMTFSDQSRCNIMFQQVVHKRGDSAMNYIKIF